jgi:hypothetical protein
VTTDHHGALFPFVCFLLGLQATQLDGGREHQQDGLSHVSCYPKYGVQQIVLYMYMHICCKFFLKIIGCVHVLRPPMVTPLERVDVTTLPNANDRIPLVMTSTTAHLATPDITRSDSSADAVALGHVRFPGNQPLEPILPRMLHIAIAQFLPSPLRFTFSIGPSNGPSFLAQSTPYYFRPAKVPFF